jgi:hypothetical protein
MRKSYFCIILVLALTLSGCSNNRDERLVFETNILSNQPGDGDIAYDSVLRRYTITQGPPALYFGIDELHWNHPEYRAFLNFPLDGSTGGDGVPLAARIISATLEIFVDNVSFAPIVPALIDLVSYRVGGLRMEDFDSYPIMSQALNFFASDYGRFVSIDITALMREAQRLRLDDLQLRLLLDPTADAGLIGIDNRPTVSIKAPLLTVVYAP